MIPHIIHLFWFGPNPKPKIVQRCIDSWKKYLPGYEMIEWSEENFDVNTIPFTKQAYEAGQYAFVSDYARLYILERDGGIYLDADEEILKDITPLLQGHKLIAGFEHSESAMVGVLGCEAHHPLIQEFMRYYETTEFKDQNGIVLAEPNPRIFTRLLKSRGLRLEDRKQILPEQICIYPTETFCAKSVNLQYCITENTYGVQHYSGSWMPWSKKLKWKIRNGVSHILGPNIYQKLMKRYERIKNKGKEKRDGYKR